MAPKRHFCRAFVQNQYAHLKSINPDTPILVREHTGEKARIMATYDFGVERNEDVDGFDETGVEQAVKSLVEGGILMKKVSE